MTHKTVPIEVTANIELIHASGIKEVLYGHKLTNEQRKLLISMFPVHSLTSPPDNTVQELREQVAELLTEINHCHSDLKYIRGQSFELAGFNKWLEIRADTVTKVIAKHKEKK